MLVLSNFFFCHYVFKKPFAAEASESVSMRESLNHPQTVQTLSDAPAAGVFKIKRGKGDVRYKQFLFKLK